MSLSSPRVICLSAVLLILTTSSFALAQHESGGVTGGGMIGGSTGRPSTKPATKAATKPATKPAATTPRRRTTPSTPVKRPATPTTTTADIYYQQGEALYNAKKYREALDKYFDAVEINPSLATALYRIGWIYNDLE